jgi:CBS domain-containing protein
VNALVKDVMTAQVVWVEQDATFAEIAAALREYRVSAFPVLGQDGKVAELMTSPAVTVWPDDTVDHAARLLDTRRVKRLPVVDAAGHLAGIVSRADAARTSRSARTSGATS